MFYGLDAMAHGAMVALLAAPVSAVLFWRLAAGLPRWRRVGLALTAAQGAAPLAAAGWALVWERGGFEDDAVGGAVLASLLLLLLIAPIFLIFSPQAPTPRS